MKNILTRLFAIFCFMIMAFNAYRGFNSGIIVGVGIPFSIIAIIALIVAIKPKILNQKTE